MVQMSSSVKIPPPRTKPAEPWNTENVPVTDGSERQMSDKDAFLKMLLTQLQNQDPMNPMENTEMTAQLAQFSQLEQLTNMNTGIKNMSSYILAQNQFQTLSMIGKDVEAQSNAISVTGGEVDVKGSLEVAQNCKLQIYISNAKGQTIRTLDWGEVEAGSFDLNWDGRDANGQKVPDGAYFFKVTAKDSANKELKEGVVPTVSGRVTSVSFDDYGQPVIHLGNAKMSLTQVIEILQSKDSAGNNSGNNEEQGG